MSPFSSSRRTLPPASASGVRLVHGQRSLANATPITGGAAGTLIKLEPSLANFQFVSRLPYLWIALGFVGVAMLLTRDFERRRFGAWLIAVRENEAAARRSASMRCASNSRRS